MRRLTGIAISFSLFLVLCSGCSLLLLNRDEDFGIVFEPTDSLLVVVSAGLRSGMEAALEQYRADLDADGVATLVVSWEGGTAEDLRDLLGAYYGAHKIDGAFLVGDLPAAWFRQYSFSRWEEFPCDLFLMDPECEWRDANSDGMYDAHGTLAPKFYVSRITGSAAELERYFAKIHDYRTGALNLPRSGWVFKDDDWSDFRRGSGFGLTWLYDSVNLCESAAETVRTNYISTLDHPGAEFIYQWIHSYPTALCVHDQGRYQYITTRDVESCNFKGLFYNLYDCSAARFTENNLGMSYLTKTDYALAVFGSAKTGGCYHPLAFNEVLSRGGSWGDAYKNWYNFYGKTSDQWFLGMVILGDPALRPHTRGPVYRFIDPSLPPEPDRFVIEEMQRLSYDFLRDEDLSGFARYQSEHPEFF